MPASATSRRRQWRDCCSSPAAPLRRISGVNKNALGGAGDEKISMNDRIFLDTNVLVYLFDGSEARKQARAQERLTTERRRSELVISTQVLQELYSALTRGQNPI